MSGKCICGITDPWTAFPWRSPVASQAHRGGTITEVISHKAGKHLCVRRTEGEKWGHFTRKELRGKIEAKIRVALWRRQKRDKSALIKKRERERDLCSTAPVNSWHWQIGDCSDVCSVIEGEIDKERERKKNLQSQKTDSWPTFGGVDRISEGRSSFLINADDLTWNSVFPPTAE